MIGLPGAAILAAALLVPTADAPLRQAQDSAPWMPAAIACGQWAETHICVGKAGCPSWQWAFNCVAEKTTPPRRLPALRSRIAYCTATLTHRRAQQGLFANQGNPLGEAMACLEGGSF